MKAVANKFRGVIFASFTFLILTTGVANADVSKLDVEAVSKILVGLFVGNEKLNRKGSVYFDNLRGVHAETSTTATAYFKSMVFKKNTSGKNAAITTERHASMIYLIDDGWYIVAIPPTGNFNGWSGFSRVE